MTDFAALYKKAKNPELTAEERHEALTLYKHEVELLEPSFIGPTWLTHPDGAWVLPEKTLGWQIIGWCAEYLNAEGSKLTPEQMRFILWWYAVNEAGEFIYRTGVLQRLKGWGKDPLLAILALVEFVGPSRFSHWDEDGEPVGEAHPKAWVQIAAVSRDQTRNTVALFPSLMSDKLISTYGIKAGEELIRAHGGRCRLEAVTSSYRALEGGRSTFVVLNETHHWVSGNKGDKMYETIDGNATKMNSRYLAITNAYLPGEDSVAERMRESYDKILERRAVGAERVDIGFLYDSIEAHPESPLTAEAIEIILPKIRGDALWLNIKAITQSILNQTIAASRSRRMYYNQVVAEEDALYGPLEWDACLDRDGELFQGDEIVLGFDGGKTHDSTALVAIRIKDSLAVPLGVWEKDDEKYGWAEGETINREMVDSAVHQAFRDYKVKAFYADVAQWESYIALWHDAYGEQLEAKANQSGNAIGWDMRQSLQKVTRSHERLMEAVFDRKLQHDGNLTLRRHTLNARRRTNPYGVSFGKESRESPRKVDAYAALMVAYEALTDYRTKAKPEKVQSKRAWFL